MSKRHQRRKPELFELLLHWVLQLASRRMRLHLRSWGLLLQLRKNGASVFLELSSELQLTPYDLS